MKAIVVFKDTENEEIDISIKFEPDLDVEDNATPAQLAALKSVELLLDYNNNGQ